MRGPGGRGSSAGRQGRPHTEEMRRAAGGRDNRCLLDVRQQTGGCKVTNAPIHGQKGSQQKRARGERLQEAGDCPRPQVPRAPCAVGTLARRTEPWLPAEFLPGRLKRCLGSHSRWHPRRGVQGTCRKGGSGGWTERLRWPPGLGRGAQVVFMVLVRCPPGTMGLRSVPSRIKTRA